MPTFIDESGDTGHEPGSASHFRLAAVWVPTHEAAEAFRATIQQLRRNLRLAAGYEFKFAKTGSHPERRQAFFCAALRHPFRFAAVSLDKREGDWRMADRGAIHWACAVSLAVTLRPIYRAEPGASLVGKVKFRGSGPDELIQLADMVCGAVAAHLDGESTWYRLIASRDLGITRIP